MQITIKDKEYQLRFGIKFIRELDKKYEREIDGVTFGTGLQMAVGSLIDYDPLILEDIIASALATEPTRPSIDDIDEWIEGQDNIEGLIDDFLKQLKTTPLTKGKVKKIIQQIEAAEV